MIIKADNVWINLDHVVLVHLTDSVLQIKMRNGDMFCWDRRFDQEKVEPLVSALNRVALCHGEGGAVVPMVSFTPAPEGMRTFPEHFDELSEETTGTVGCVGAFNAAKKIKRRNLEALLDMPTLDLLHFVLDMEKGGRCPPPNGNKKCPHKTPNCKMCWLHWLESEVTEDVH